MKETERLLESLAIGNTSSTRKSVESNRPKSKNKNKKLVKSGTSKAILVTRQFGQRPVPSRSIRRHNVDLSCVSVVPEPKPVSTGTQTSGIATRDAGLQVSPTLRTTAT